MEREGLQLCMSCNLGIQKLAIGPRYPYMFLSTGNDQPPPMFCKLKSLTIEPRIIERELSWIASLLKNTPELEKLTINVLQYYKDKNNVESGGKKSLGWKERYFKCLFRHLKIVEITFATLFPHCELEEFLIKNGKALEKMAVLVKNTGIWRRMSSPDEKKVQQLVLSYPRASPNVAVLLDIPSY